MEQDIAISNIALDLIGQARNFYQYAAELINNQSNPFFSNPVTEDSLAYLRDAREFKNCLLAEQPNGDWAQTIARQFFFTVYQHSLYNLLSVVKDERVAAIAAKALKEVTYHVRWAGEWVIRLGDGTAESHNRMQAAINNLWPFTHELFMPVGYETEILLNDFGVNMASVKNHWINILTTVLDEAALAIPATADFVTGGKEGKHSAYLESILLDMQYLQRAYPGCEW